MLGRATTVARIVLLLAASGCLSFAAQAEKIRAAVVGMPDKAVIDCLGPPENLFVLESDDHQIWVYKPRLVKRGAPSSQADLKNWGSEGNPIGRFRSAEPAPATPFPVDAAPRAAPEGPDDAVDPRDPRGLCRLSFEFRDGTVSAFQVTGHDYRGMNADGRCALQAKHCVAGL